MWKKIRLYFQYRKIIKQNITQLRTKFVKEAPNNAFVIKNLDLDWLCRLYTVLNFKQQTQENIDRYGYYFMDNEVKKFIFELEKELRNIGLFELYGLERADQITPNQVWVVVDFKPFSPATYAKKAVWLSVGGLALIIGALIYFF